MSEQMLEVSTIRIDGDTQPRLAIDQEVVNEYAQAMQAGAEFPPVQVVSDGAANWLVDGFHRFYAHRRIARGQIKAVVTTGLLTEAQWMSLTANKTHGLRRTNQDKIKAVLKAIKMRPELSDRLIAEHVGVHGETVAKYRAELEKKSTIGRPDSRLGRDGRTYHTKPITRAQLQKNKTGPSTKPNTHTAIRGYSKPVETKTPVSMPKDPDMGAHTLFDLFDREYISKLVTRLSALLDGTAGPAPLLRDLQPSANV